MKPKGLAVWLLLCAIVPPLAGAFPSGKPEDDRQRILAQVAGEDPPAGLRDAEVFLSGDLAAVRLPAGIDNPAVYILERFAGAEGWSAVARFTAAGEEHFGDAVLLSPDAILVAAPDRAGAGLGPGATYVFQRDVGGKNDWGLVAKLGPQTYPPVGSITIEQLAGQDSAETALDPPAAGDAMPPPAVAEAPPSPPVAPAPPAVAASPPPATAAPPATPPPAVVPSPPPAVAAAPPAAPPPAVAPSPPAAAPPAAPPPAVAPSTPVAAPPAPPPPAVVAPPASTPTEAIPAGASTAVTEPVTGEAGSDGDADGSPASEDGLRYIAVATMREMPHALALAAVLRDCGYPSEVHRSQQDFFIVTLARLPLAEARSRRDEAVAAGDVTPDAYLIVGTGLQERISH